MTVVYPLDRDPLLLGQEGRYRGSLILPWGYGVMLTNISHKAFDQTDLGEVIDPALTICKDEMTKSGDTYVCPRQRSAAPSRSVHRAAVPTPAAQSSIRFTHPCSSSRISYTQNRCTSQPSSMSRWLRN